jgi:hypothetical protein
MFSFPLPNGPNGEWDHTSARSRGSIHDVTLSLQFCPHACPLHSQDIGAFQPLARQTSAQLYDEIANPSIGSNLELNIVGCFDPAMGYSTCADNILDMFQMMDFHS